MIDRFITGQNNNILMKKLFFKTLVKINNTLLPSLYKKDPMKLTNFQKAILGYKYWTLTHSLN